LLGTPVGGLDIVAREEGEQGVPFAG